MEGHLEHQQLHSQFLRGTEDYHAARQIWTTHHCRKLHMPLKFAKPSIGGRLHSISQTKHRLNDGEIALSHFIPDQRLLPSSSVSYGVDR